MRVQKIIANYGYCSRRRAEELIQKGKVKVNGKIITLGDKASLADKITVKGKVLKEPKKLYIAMNKPKGVETTLVSTFKKPTVVSLLKKMPRVIPCGRLDVDSRGLLFLTNDGDFANRIMHPKYPIDKIYRVKVRGKIPISKIERLAKGIDLEEGRTAPCDIRIIKQSAGTTMLSMKLHEGKKREIRRMISAVGYDVLDLIRQRIGPITLKGIREGQYRELKKNEVKKIKSILGMI